jgi:hypothetical protein
MPLATDATLTPRSRRARRFDRARDAAGGRVSVCARPWDSRERARARSRRSAVRGRARGVGLSSRPLSAVFAALRLRCVRPRARERNAVQSALLDELSLPWTRWPRFFALLRARWVSRKRRRTSWTSPRR